jgi:uncharacterized membrane protein YedE/YeeE
MSYADGGQDRMTDFTPISALIGGALIGVSAVALMFLNGRIAGISGLTAGILSFSAIGQEQAWRIAFVLGLVVGPISLRLINGQSPDIAFVAPPPTMVAAGLCVGFGTVLGNGCTSGHGVCGIARLSMRSVIATAVFMFIGMLTTFVMRHLLSGG